jgi:selenocysteine lyase/cysteine desulfurase
MKSLKRIGFDALDEVELKLTRKFLKGLEEIPGAAVYGLTGEENMHRRLGVIAFNLKDTPHDLVAAILAGEGGIGVRNGCFCAHPYVLQMLHVDHDVAEGFRSRLRNGDKTDIPGAVRVSFGMYNTVEEVDRVLKILRDINDGCCQDLYEQDERGTWRRKTGEPEYAEHVRQIWDEILPDGRG